MRYIDLLVRAAEGVRHPNYKRTTDLASQYISFYTGEDMDQWMRRFDLREDDDQFAQRKRITQHITRTVMRNLLKPQYKVPRANNVQRIVKYVNDDNNSKAETLEKILDKFNGTTSVDEYMRDEWIRLSNIDPNAFVILEWGDFDSKTENAEPYPFEVYSEDVCDFQYDNRVLGYLIVYSKIVEEIIEDNRIKEVLRDRYTLYNNKQTITFTETDEKGDPYEVGKEYPSGTIIATREEKFWVIEYIKPHNLGFVPAFRVGYIGDEVTRNVTRISLVDDAIPILMKMVKSNSELDLTMSLHAYPQKVQYAKGCDYEGCIDGTLPEGDTCPRCNGLGIKTITSTQDSLIIKLPKDTKDIVDIRNLIHYVYPPVDLVKFQDAYIKDLSEWCKEAVYNTEIFSRKEIAETATGKNIDLQNIYDSLYGLAEAYAEDWEFIVNSIAKIVDKEDELTARMIFSKDFKMKSLFDLYNELKLVSDSKADSFVKDQIQDDIARIMYHDNPSEYYKWQTKKAFFPFSGKTPQEIALALSSPLIPEDIVKLYHNFGWLLDAIAMDYEKENLNFWILPRLMQKEIIDKELAKIKTQPILEPQLGQSTGNTSPAGGTLPQGKRDAE
jgi:hypothetical protein